MDSFSLLDNPVFPVTDTTGPARVGLRGLLLRAHQLHLAVADGLQLAATLRFLLAVSIDAAGLPDDPRDWRARFRVGRFDANIVDGFFDAFADRFDLLGVQPAWQVAGLESASGERKPSSLLMPAIATGNNVPLFSSRSEGDPPALGLADAALAALAAHAWDTAAIKTGAVGDPRTKAGKTTGNPVGPLGQIGVVMPVGPTLFHTLMLNTPVAASTGPLGTPWWRRDPVDAEWQIREPDGLLDLLTWQSRRIRLFPETDAAGRRTVRQVLVCAGDRLASIPTDVEIHTVWKPVDKPKAGDPPRRAVRHRAGRALWRGMAGLLAVHGSIENDGLQTSRSLAQIAALSEAGAIPDDFPLGIVAVGVEYGNQSAVVENVYLDRMPLPITGLGAATAVAAALQLCARQADDLRVALNTLADNVRRACGAEPVPWDKSQRPGDQMIAQFDRPIRALLSGLQRDPQRALDALDAWSNIAHRIALEAADPVIDAAPAGGFIGRGSGRQFMSTPLAETFYRAKVRKILHDPATKENAA